MIYTIRGILTEADVTGSFIVIECGGVGYKLTVTANTLTSLPTPVYTPSGDLTTGNEVRVYTYMAVKEDAVERFREEVGKNYTEKIGYAPSFIVDDIGDGGCEIK